MAPQTTTTQQTATRTSLALIITSPFAVNAFWSSHLEAMSKVYDVSVLVNIVDQQLKDVVTKVPPGVTVIPLKLRREINPLDDLRALLAIRRFLIGNNVKVAITMTPKAGLTGMLAARWAKVPVRIHWFTGQVWVNRKGWMRQLLKNTDRLTVRASTAALVDSHTQVDFLARENIAPRSRFEVLGSGSVSGVDCTSFAPDPDTRREVRAELGIADDEIVMVFAGRVNRDKGVPELLEAFTRLRQAGHRVRLLVVGPEEGAILPRPLPDAVLAIGYTQTLHRYFKASDIFCLPSHREGFGLVLIEAGACGLPAIASRIYGITDAMLDGVTGLLHTAEDANDIAAKAERLIRDPALRKQFGDAARARALKEFSSSRLTDLLMARVACLLKTTARIP